MKPNFPHSDALFISQLANNCISVSWLGEGWASWEMRQMVQSVKVRVTENRSQAHCILGTEFQNQHESQSQTELNSNLKAIIYRALDKFLNCSVLVSSSMKQENDSASWCCTLLELQVKRSLLLQVLSRYLTIGSHKDHCWILNHLLELLNSPTLTWSWVTNVRKLSATSFQVGGKFCHCCCVCIYPLKNK